MKRDSGKKVRIEELLRKGMSVSEIAAELGVSRAYVSQIKKRIEQKDLTRTGEKEAIVFKLLKEGKHPIDIVIELKLPADEVERIYEKYLNLRELPTVTQFDILEEFEEEKEDLKKETLGEVAEIIKKTSAILEGHIKNNTGKLERKIQKLEKEVEKIDNKEEEHFTSLLGVLKEMAGILTCISAEGLLERTLVAGMSEKLKDPLLSTYIKATEDACELLVALDPKKEKVSKVVERLENIKSAFEAFGYTEAVAMIENLLQILNKDATKLTQQ